MIDDNIILSDLAEKCQKEDWDVLINYWGKICILPHEERPFFWEIPGWSISIDSFLEDINKVGFDNMKVAIKYKGWGDDESKWYIFAEYIEEMNIDHSKKLLGDEIGRIFREISN